MIGDKLIVIVHIRKPQENTEADDDHWNYSPEAVYYLFLAEAVYYLFLV